MNGKLVLADAVQIIVYRNVRKLSYIIMLSTALAI